MARSEFKRTLAGALPRTREAAGVSKPAPAPVAVTPATFTPQEDGAPAPTSGPALPELLSAERIEVSKIVLPPILIEDLLHRGCKMVLAGGSKSYKSWALVDLGLSVAAGVPWWSLNCQQGVVVYLNFELIQGFFEWRIHHIARAKGIKLPPWFLYWNLRHKCYDLATLGRVLKERIKAIDARVDLIIVDPIYKALGGLDENSASEMAVLMQEIENLSEETGACVVFGAHFSKGNQATKEDKDKISGSGVFGRDPDAILTMTRHSKDWCYSIGSDLRYVPPIPPFVVQWKFPLMHIEEGADPNDLHVPNKPSKEKEGEEPFTTEDVLAALSHSGYQDSAWKAAMLSKHGKAGNAYYTAKKLLIEQGRVRKQGLKYLPTGFALETERSS